MDGTVGNETWNNTADRVLVDAPCSGLGVIRRKPEIKYKGITEFSQLVDIQAKILDASAKYVKSKGVLVYSTCTINIDENEKQIENFLERNKDFELIMQKQFLPTEDIDGFYVCKMIKK